MFCMRCPTPVRNKEGEIVRWNRGRVVYDQVFSENNHVELFCIRCGKRWMIDKTKGAFGAWLDRKAKSTA